MSIFKSNKNKTASAATTPSQTPRSSTQTARPSLPQAKGMTRDQALESLMKKTAGTTSFNYKPHFLLTCTTPSLVALL
ncbi:hypothetical protein BG003_000188 [Podila horticola]|nr:hypothetical protein BG003_000188 [Podila horticola]